MADIDEKLEEPTEEETLSSGFLTPLKVWFSKVAKVLSTPGKSFAALMSVTALVFNGLLMFLFGK